LETLLARVFKRDQSVENKKDLIDRLKTSINEYNIALSTHNYIFVVNDDLNRALDEINQILDGNIPPQEDKIKLINELKDQIEEYLKVI
jgi:guanylate kinase